MTPTVIWITVLLNSVGSYAIKLAGQSLPSWILQVPRVNRLALLLPIALLSALVAVLTFAQGTGLVLDARLAGLGFAIVALLLRAPFLVVVIGAAVVAALVRLAVG
jgi:branched chain amino acid efflux pump